MPSPLRPRHALLAAALTLGAAEPPVFSGGAAVEGSRAFAADADGDDLAVDDGLAEARLFWRPHPALRLGIGAGLQRARYDGDALAGIDGVHQAWLRLPLALMVSPHWGMTSQTSLGSGVADGQPWRSGRQWQVQAGPVWVRDEDLIIALLVNVSSRDGMDPAVFAFPSLYWRFHEVWRLTVVDEIDNLSRLRWRAREELELGLRLDVRLREYTLADDGVLVDDHIGLALEAAWRPFADDGLAVTPFAGATLWRRLTLRDGDGDEADSTTVRPAAVVGLGLRCDF